MGEVEKLRALLAEARETLSLHDGVVECDHPECRLYRFFVKGIDAALAEPVVKKPILDALRSAVSCETLERIVTERGQAIAALEREVIRLSRLEESLPASLRDAHDVVRGLERERDEARAQIEQMNLEAADVRRLARSMAEDAFRKRDEAQERAEERNDEANRLQRYLNMAAKERDEARAELAFIATEYEKANASDFTRDALAMQSAALKAAVERVMGERDEAESELALHKSERLRLRAEDLRLRREVERLQSLKPIGTYSLDWNHEQERMAVARAAYQRGAEAMREAAAEFVRKTGWDMNSQVACSIGVLPIPEDK